MLGCWLGGDSVEEARRLFREAGIAGFETPEEAVRAFAMLVTYRRNQAQLIEAAPARPVDAHAPAEQMRALGCHRRVKRTVPLLTSMGSSNAAEYTLRNETSPVLSLGSRSQQTCEWHPRRFPEFA